MRLPPLAALAGRGGGALRLGRRTGRQRLAAARRETTVSHIESHVSHIEPPFRMRDAGGSPRVSGCLFGALRRSDRRPRPL